MRRSNADIWEAGMCIVLVYCCESVTNNTGNEQCKFTVKLVMVSTLLYLPPAPVKAFSTTTYSRYVIALKVHFQSIYRTK